MKRGMKITLGVVAGIVVVGGAGACSSASPSPTSAAAPEATQASATTVAPVNDVRSNFLAWRDGGGLTLLDSISTDMGAITDAGKATDAVAMNTACVSLQVDVESAQAYAPIPDAQTQQSWAAGLAQAARSAGDCITATRTQDAQLLLQASAEIKEAGNRFVDATKRIKVLAG
jgi:hypothetical protein